MKLMLSIVLTLSLFLWGQSPAPLMPITRVLNEAGWEIPGLKGAHTKTGSTPRSSGQSNGFSYQVTVLVPDPKMKHYVVPMVSVDKDQQQAVFKELRFKPTEIHRFEVAGKPYCYQVSGMIYSQDPRTKTGGYAGTIELLYYDQSGSGVWTVLDTGGLLLPGVPQPPPWAARK
jgi:hypothetical protein